MPCKHQIDACRLTAGWLSAGPATPPMSLAMRNAVDHVAAWNHFDAAQNLRGDETVAQNFRGNGAASITQKIF
jgi:hypothetical protein